MELGWGGRCRSYGDDSEVDVLGVQGVGAGALQDAEVGVVLFDRLVDASHGLHRLHPTGHHHGPPWVPIHQRVSIVPLA